MFTTPIITTGTQIMPTAGVQTPITYALVPTQVPTIQQSIVQPSPVQQIYVAENPQPILIVPKEEHFVRNVPIYENDPRRVPQMIPNYNQIPFNQGYKNLNVNPIGINQSGYGINNSMYNPGFNPSGFNPGYTPNINSSFNPNINTSLPNTGLPNTVDGNNVNLADQMRNVGNGLKDTNRGINQVIGQNVVSTKMETLGTGINKIAGGVNSVDNLRNNDFEAPLNNMNDKVNDLQNAQTTEEKLAAGGALINDATTGAKNATDQFKNVTSSMNNASKGITSIKNMF